MPEFSQSKSLFLYRDRENFLRTISARISHSSVRAGASGIQSRRWRRRRAALRRPDNGSANDKWPDANLERASASGAVLPFGTVAQRRRVSTRQGPGSRFPPTITSPLGLLRAANKVFSYKEKTWLRDPASWLPLVAEGEFTQPIIHLLA